MTGKNVFGEPLELCSERPKTGFFRDGCCNTDETDLGEHTVCVVTTSEFLEFSKSVGNDLSSPIKAFSFKGLKPGDRWCLCASRWIEAYRNNCAPKIVLAATNETILKHVPMEILLQYAYYEPQPNDNQSNN